MNAEHAPSPRSSAERIQNDIFRRMTPEKRLERAFRWTNITLEFCRSGVRSQRPDWSAARVEREVFRRATGIDLEPRFGPLPEDAPPTISDAASRR